MAGRTVEIPATIKSVICADMTATYFMYALAPKLLSGRNMKPTSSEVSLIDQKFLDLPVVGVIFYGKSTFNLEATAKLHPDILLCPLFHHTTPEYIADYEEFGHRLGIPIVMVALDLEKLPEAFTFMGTLLGKEKTAAEFSQYSQQTLNWADSIRANISNPLSVYVAEGKDGLYTISAGSTHSQVIEMAGAKNCALVDESYGYKNIPVSFEQILNWQPDYILVNSRASTEIESEVINQIKKDKVWQSLRAVKENKILVVPTVPFNWIGRPPGINRLIGIRWIASSLYPNVAQINIEEEVVRFFSMFYHVNISGEEVKALLNTNQH